MRNLINTHTHTHTHTHTYHGDESGGGSGDGDGDEDKGSGNEDMIGEGGREAKKRKKSQNSCRRHVGNGGDLAGWKEGKM